MNQIPCVRCKETKEALDRPPFRNELGERIQGSICQTCWQEWLQHQTLLINHYGLDPRESSSREFLYGQIKAVLLGEGEVKEVDTSREGSVEW